ncbi:hypothetical protein GH714_032356 [Hevea brasiliensis]|uniref:Uncharacterized protein n=1 Tax=Hevea brasiliensis TaxID=3981 RepID=A0A6A6LHF2_HEVBR|nr:hypothetical protein GH714_032356 [Hevea brasiliensis]
MVGPPRHGSGPFAAIVENESVVESYIKGVGIQYYSGSWMDVGAVAIVYCSGCGNELPSASANVEALQVLGEAWRYDAVLNPMRERCRGMSCGIEW